jgi:hypothetical protein
MMADEVLRCGRDARGDEMSRRRSRYEASASASASTSAGADVSGSKRRHLEDDLEGEDTGRGKGEERISGAEEESEEVFCVLKLALWRRRCPSPCLFSSDEHVRTYGMMCLHVHDRNQGPVAFVYMLLCV